MVSKLKELEKADEGALVDAVCSSAHQIWQAGLGAFAKAQEEGGDVFSRLVQEGSDLQKRLQQLAGDNKAFGVADTVTRLAENVGRQASGSWDRIEKVFEERVARSLRGFGVPTRDDIKALAGQIEALNQSIAALASPKKSQKKAAAAPAPAKRATTRTEKAAAKVPPKKSPKATKAPVRGVARKQPRAAAGHA